MKRSLLYLLFIALFNFGFGQNQNQLTQYMIYQPFLNPAAIATYDNFSAGIAYRNQWIGIKGAPTNTSVAFNSKVKTSKLYLGGIATQESIGPNNNVKASAQIAYKLKLNRSQSLSLALKGGVGYFQADYSSMFLADGGDASFSQTQNTQLLPNFGFGALWFSPKHYIGVSIPTFLSNTITTNTNFSSNNFHIYLNGGYKFILNPKFDLNVSSFVKYSEGIPLHADFNAQLLYNKQIGIGINYRSSREVSGILTWYINTNIGISYAYDFTFSRLSSLSGGSHEIMLTFSKNPKKLLFINCPRF